MVQDIICISTDGASVMTKLGRLMSEQGVEQQLCLAHGTHLAITKVLVLNIKIVLPVDHLNLPEEYKYYEQIEK